MKNLAKKLTCGTMLSFLYGSLSACGVTSEVATTHPSSPTLVSAVGPATASEGHGAGGGRTGRPAPAGAAVPRPARPVGAAVAMMPAMPRYPSPAPVEPAASLAAAPDLRNMRTQSGRIIDEAGQPLVGATVLLKGTTRGTSTDANGDYSLAVPLGVNTFIVGYSGYTDEVAQSPDGQPLTVTLLPIAGRAPATSPAKASRLRARRKR